MKRFLSRLLHAFFPSHCIYCGELTAPDMHCCDDCREKLVAADENGTVYAVSRVRNAKALIAVYRYDKLSRKAVFDLKFHDQRGTAAPIAREMADKVNLYYLEQSVLPKHALDIVLPVPMHPKAIRKRGYNQSALLAKRIAKQLDIPYSDLILCKVRHTKKQHTVSLRERETNLENAFAVKFPAAVEGKRIQLVDDVCTSGNTFAHCAKTLKDAGAKEIVCTSFLLRKGRWRHYCYPKDHFPKRYRF